MSKVKLKVSMRMKCAMHGEGDISAIGAKKEYYPIMVFHESDREHRIYTEDGRFDFHCNPTLKLLNIPFTEGMEVECDIYGSGKVNRIYESTAKYPVYVIFETGDEIVYTLDGRISQNANQTLFPKYEI